MFKKAVPEQGFIKASMHGASGHGKTFTALLFAEELAKHEGKRIALIDTENGYHFYVSDVKERKVHPDGFDVDVLPTTSMVEALDAVKNIDPEVYGVVIVDQASTLWDAMQAAVPDDKKNSNGSIPMHLWGSIKPPYKEFIRILVNGQYHTLLLGRQRNVFEDNAGHLKKTGVEMRCEGETPYEFNLTIRMEAKKSESDSSKSTYMAIVEKDRSGILAGRTIAIPSYKTIEPIMVLLNGHHVVSEEPEETALRDSELFERQAEKKKEKSEKSRQLFNDFNSKIIGCESLDVLAEIANEIKKQKRYMQGEHTDSLGEVYKNRRDELTKNIVPEGV